MTHPAPWDTHDLAYKRAQRQREAVERLRDRARKLSENTHPSEGRAWLEKNVREHAGDASFELDDDHYASIMQEGTACTTRRTTRRGTASKRRGRTPTGATPSSRPPRSVRAGGTSGPFTPAPGTTPNRRDSRWRETRSRTGPSEASPTAGAGSSTHRFIPRWSAWVTAPQSAAWFGKG